MTSILTEEFLSALLYFLTIASGTIVGVTVSLSLPVLNKPPNKPILSNWKKQLFRDTCLYAIIPVIFVYVLKAFAHETFESQPIILLAISVLSGLVGKQLTYWFTEIRNVIPFIFACLGGMGELKEFFIKKFNETKNKSDGDK